MSKLFVIMFLLVLFCSENIVSSKETSQSIDVQTYYENKKSSTISFLLTIPFYGVGFLYCENLNRGLYFLISESLLTWGVFSGVRSVKYFSIFFLAVSRFSELNGVLDYVEVFNRNLKRRLNINNRVILSFNQEKNNSYTGLKYNF